MPEHLYCTANRRKIVQLVNQGQETRVNLLNFKFVSNKEVQIDIASKSEQLEENLRKNKEIKIKSAVQVYVERIEGSF